MHGHDIRNTCRMFDNLFQLVRSREMKCLNPPNISVGGFEPVSVVYIEVSNIENFRVCVCVRACVCNSLLIKTP